MTPDRANRPKPASCLPGGHAGEMAGDHPQKQQCHELVDASGRHPKGIGGEGRKGALLLDPALDEEAGQDQQAEDSEESKDHRCAARVVAGVMGRPPAQQAGEMGDHLAGREGEAGEAAIASAEEGPDGAEQEEPGYDIAGDHMGPVPRLRREEARGKSEEHRRHEDPVEESRGQVPDQDLPQEGRAGASDAEGAGGGTGRHAPR